ncbi:MAG TPA: outer membrane beta-barrel protein [Chthoniobacterales bacterium]|nr:outer membrane beta-barrel protein [Chthoniobacterales bacterium]
MKRLTLTLMILCGLCALAYAGAEVLPSGKDMAPVAVPPSCPNWTGFYFGLSGGFDYAVVDPRTRVDEDENEDAAAIDEHGSFNLDAGVAEIGGLIGFNYQLHKWVLGVEAEGAYLWLKNTREGLFSTPDDPLDFGEGYYESTSFRSRYLVTAGPRIGYALCKWLPYVTGGVAFGDLDLRQRISELDDFDEFRSTSATNVGWFVGGGAQYSLTNHWSARLQYKYIDLGDIGFNHFVDPFDEITAGRTTAELREHVASFAIVFGF